MTTRISRLRTALRDALLGGVPSLREGDPAPEWDVEAVPGGRTRLADLRGRWVVLYFFPKADTPGCTRQACSIRDASALSGPAVYGASRDLPSSLAAFRQKYGLPFPMLSDPRGVLARRYGVLGRVGAGRFVRRTTFVIDPEGRVRLVLRDPDTQRHGVELVEALRALGALSDGGTA